MERDALEELKWQAHERECESAAMAALKERERKRRIAQMFKTFPYRVYATSPEGKRELVFHVRASNCNEAQRTAEAAFNRDAPEGWSRPRAFEGELGE